MIKDIVIGATSYLRHLSLVRKNGLGKYFLAPIFIGVLLLGTIGTSAYGLSDDLGNLLISWYPLETGANFVKTFSTIFSGILILVTGLILTKYLIIILASPFMSPMSKKIEDQGIHKPHLPYQELNAIQGIIRGLRLASTNIIKEVIITLVLLILSFVLPIISPFTAILIFLVQAYYAGCGNMDFTLERYLGVRDSRRFTKANRGLAVGNGIVFMALLMLGIGIFVAPPLGTLAATPEVLKRLDEY